MVADLVLPSVFYRVPMSRSKCAIHCRINQLANLAGFKPADYINYVREEMGGEKLSLDPAVEQQYSRQSCSPTVTEGSKYSNEHVGSKQGAANVKTPRDSFRTVGLTGTQEYQDVKIILEPYERSLILTIRSFLRDKGYEAPPDHSKVDDSLYIILREVDRGIAAFMESHHVAQVPARWLTEDSLHLGRTIVENLREDRGKSSLDILWADPNMSMDLVLRVYAAAAIYKWILRDLENEPACGEIQPSYQRLGLFDQREYH